MVAELVREECGSLAQIVPYLSLSPSLEKPIDLNSKKEICFKEVERQVGAVAGEISSH